MPASCSCAESTRTIESADCPRCHRSASSDSWGSPLSQSAIVFITAPRIAQYCFIAAHEGIEAHKIP